jgi:putative transposase
MKDYRRGTHTTFEIHLHLVWVTKYRKPVMTGEVGTRLRELIREVCRNQEVTIIKGHLSKGHVHLFERWGRFRSFRRDSAYIGSQLNGSP